MAVRLARIDLFPIKSFDSVSVESARVLPWGGIEQDRRFALVDAQGKFINGKRTPLVHALRLSFDERFERVTIAGRCNGRKESFSLADDRPAIESRLSEHFGMAVMLREDAAGGFPDDTLASGPTVIAAETLATVADWFGLSAENARQRFRANLTIEGGGPFWDDRLFGPPGQPVAFRIGELMFFGTNPCARCVVPSRDPETAEQVPNFAKAFALRRRESLPPWADPDAFDHHFRLAVNTRLYAPAEGSVIRVGDTVELLEEG
jgi:hypothetical protein